VTLAFTCAHCGKAASQPASAVNRARSKGLNLYCDRTCAGLGRRKHQTKAELVERKRIYDEQYRATNRAMLKAKKAAHFRRTYDPVKAAEQRKLTMPRHVEYCRRPEYRKRKAEYDRAHRAGRMFGDYADCFLLLQDLETEIASRMSKYEIKLANGTLNKRHNRRREHGHFISG
jgi:hypothetical protein